jgi:hypothetical protein
MPKKKSMEDRIAALEAKINGKLTTRILVIQDRSGSMHNRITETIDGFNEYIGSLAEDKSDKAYLTLVQFDDYYEVLENATPVSSVSKLTEETFVPRGWTALFDAVGRGITEFKKTLNEGDRAFVVIMTDGGENYSKEFTRPTISSLIKQCEEEGNWTFTFLGAGRYAWGGAEAMGLNRNQAAFYGNDSHSHATAYAGITQTTRRFRGGGQSAMSNTGAVLSDMMSQEGADVQLEGEPEHSIEPNTGVHIEMSDDAETENKSRKATSTSGRES